MSSAIGKKALLLGAGFVCEPVVQILSEAGVRVTVACRNLSSAQELAGEYKDASAVALDAANDVEGLKTAVAAADVVISLIPYIHHVKVVQAAIACRKPVVTTSYISPALWELDGKVKAAGITVLNEIGLDPGIDHLYAVKTIDEVHRAGGKITSFTSYCGALPAPENSGNPLGYKFSWSPRGGLLALLNSARWYQDGEIVTVQGEDLMATSKPHHIFPGFNLVGYPNRDAVGFREFYRIPEARTVFRATMRYAGFTEIVRTLVAIGYFSQEEVPGLAIGATTPLTWAQLTSFLLGLEGSPSVEDLKVAVSKKAAAFISDKNEVDRVISGLNWLGLFDKQKPVDGRITPLDTLCAILERQMAYEPGERDMIILQHTFDVENADGSKEKRLSTLVEYGEPLAPGSRSAMAKLVGLPCATGVLAVLEGRVSQKGMVAPWSSVELAEMFREKLRSGYGIEMKEKIVA